MAFARPGSPAAGSDCMSAMSPATAGHNALIAEPALIASLKREDPLVVERVLLPGRNSIRIRRANLSARGKYWGDAVRSCIVFDVTKERRIRPAEEAIKDQISPPGSRAQLNNSDAGRPADPAAVAWRKWHATHTVADRLCRHQQRPVQDILVQQANIRLDKMYVISTL